jgi:hypothetical protein
VGLFDWLRRGRRGSDPPLVWNVYRDGADVVVEDGRGGIARASVSGARTVRVVPLTGGNPHVGAQAGGWQVALGHASGDALVGKPMADWRAARELAQQLCDKTALPLDEMTEKLFSRVGQFTPRPPREG